MVERCKKQMLSEIAKRKEESKKQMLSEIEDTQKEISEYEQKQAETLKAKENLKKFNVKRSRFYFRESAFSDYTDSVIELTVTNGTKYAVSKAYFHGILSSPGRSIPWVEDSFNYTILGGIEPGEEVTWKLPTGMLSWGNAPKDRKDMVLTVTVTRIDGANENPIYDSEFSEWDMERLEELNQRLVELQKNLLFQEKHKNVLIF